MSLLAIVLTSAAVGAIASGLLTLIGQALERRARRDELVFQKALEMAIRRTDVIMQVLEQQPGRVAIIHDDVVTAASYYQWLKSLLEHGQLPPDAPTTSTAPPTP
ncbi:MAG TPA: hypothetical protein VML95_02055 [Longimicrobiales bacterium]|nr:hypothetical protein [Longimicrobiales bacterium]